MRLWLRVGMFTVALAAIVWVLGDASALHAQEAPPAAATGEAELIDVEIDWIAELWKGGFTVLAQLVLSVIGLGIAIERLIYIRQRHFAPPALLRDLLQKGQAGDWDGVLASAKGSRSLLARIATFIAEHRYNDLAHIQQGAGDIGVREMRHQLQRVYPLAIVGSLEPLLGLLGTMIGMIEAFALVAIYGDEGGASLLADSIAKALITTAVGLVIAIPALGIYYWLKQRTLGYMSDLETAVESLIDTWFLKPENEARRKQQETEAREREALRQAIRARGASAKGGVSAAKGGA